MKLKCRNAEWFVPDGRPPDDAIARTTHMAVGAHPDDLEIMAFDGILQCFQREDRWFTGVVVTTGAGSPRDGVYRDYTDEAMSAVRAKEQKKAAVIGEYAALVLLGCTGQVVKDALKQDLVEDLSALLAAARPQVLYTHNLADKHETHVAVTLRVIEAVRRLEPELRPPKLLGCEVWRDLDWMTDNDKVVLDVSSHENLQAALLGVFDSQIAGGKRYDLATLGRRRAHATYHSAYSTDAAAGVTYAMDLTPLILDPTLDIPTYVQRYLDRFRTEVIQQIQTLT